MADQKAQALCNEVINAINVLYTHPDNAVQKQADNFVSQFQNTVEAWRVADMILQRPSLSLQVYSIAAQTFRAKVLSDFHELAEQSARLSFRDCVVQHIMRFAAVPEVLNFLVLTLGDLAVHMCEEWPDIPAWIVDKLSGNPLILLEALTALAEEVPNQRLRLAHKDRQHRAASIFNQFFPSVMQLLAKGLSSTGNNRKLQEKVFTCFGAWLRFGKLPPDVLLQSPLLTTTFEGIAQVKELFDPCVEVAVQLIRNTSDVNAYSAVISLILKYCLALMPQFDEAIKEGDDERQKAFTRIFAEMGDAYLLLIVNPFPQALSVVEALLKCVTLEDRSTVALTFRFWYDLARHVTAPDTPARDTRSIFTPYFVQLVNNLRVSMEYPSDSDSWKENDLDDYKNFRHLAGDCLVDAASVLGGVACLNHLFQSLKVQWELYSKQPESWRGLESCLHCVRSIARRVDLSEHYVMPQIMEILPHLAKTKHSQVRYTAALVVGRYADWLNLHPKFIPHILGFVVNGLSDAKEVVSACTLAFKHVCDGCTVHLTSQAYVSQLFLVYNHAVSLPLADQKDIIEGLCFVVSSLPPDQIAAALRTMLEPIATDVQGALAEYRKLKEEHTARVRATGAADPVATQHSLERLKVLQERVCLQLDRLAHVFMNIDPKSDGFVGRATNASIAKGELPSRAQTPEAKSQPQGASPAERARAEELERVRAAIIGACVEMLTLLWPLMDAVLNTWKGDDTVMERLSRCWRFAVKTTQLEFAPFLVPLVKTLSDLFVQAPHSSFIYVAAICVDAFGGEERFHSVLIDIFTVFSQRALSVLGDAKSFVDRPEIVEDFFDLMSRFFKRSPTLVLKPDNTVLMAVTQRALLGLGVEHKDACSSLMAFFGDMFQKGRPDAPPQCVQTVSLILQHYGQPLVNGLLAGIAGGLPHTRIRYVINAIDNMLLLTHHLPFIRSLFANALMSYPETQDPDKATFLSQLMAAKTSENVRDTIYHWETAIRRLPSSGPR